MTDTSLRRLWGKVRSSAILYTPMRDIRDFCELSLLHYSTLMAVESTRSILCHQFFALLGNIDNHNVLCRTALRHLPGDVVININLQNEILCVIAQTTVSR